MEIFLNKKIFLQYLNRYYAMFFSPRFYQSSTCLYNCGLKQTTRFIVTLKMPLCKQTAMAGVIIFNISQKIKEHLLINDLTGIL